MRYLDTIQRSLDYIEENLKTTISAQELSEAAGFSVFHYYRIFQSVVGMPVMQYIIRRKLLWTIYEIAGGRRQIDAALQYGFDTSAGFYKAFRREFGCSPSEYVAKHPVRKPYRINLMKEEYIMVNHKSVRKALENWGMQYAEVGNVVYPSGEISENTFRVGKEHFIKAYSVPAKAKNNAEILTALKKAGLSRGSWLPTLDGRSFAEEGAYCYLLLNRIPGQAVQLNELFGCDGEKTACYLGRVIGRLHEVLKNNDAILCNERNIFEEVRDQWLLPAKNAASLSDEFCREYLDVFGELHPHLPVQIIHRDPHPGNIIMCEGKVAGFIDFELSQRSIRLFDICYAATGVLVESGACLQGNGENLKRWLVLYRQLVHGYDSTAHLTREEKKALPYVVLSIQIICVGYFSGNEKFSELAKANTAMLHWLMAHRTDLEF